MQGAVLSLCKQYTPEGHASESVALCSGLKQRNADFLSCSNKLTVQAGQRQAFLNGEVQVGGIVNSQAVLVSEGEDIIVRCWFAEAHIRSGPGEAP